MSRITDIEIAGKTYPMNFSTSAAKKIMAKYGRLEQIDQVLADKPLDELLDDVVWILALLIDQGVAYKRLSDGETLQGLTAEDLEVLLGVHDMVYAKQALMSSLLAGSSREVEVEPDLKNAETTQE